MPLTLQQGGGFLGLPSVDFAAFTARLKPCPFKTGVVGFEKNISAACEAVAFQSSEYFRCL
jgi:hypothetical protein